MPKPTFSTQISIGNLVQIAILIVAMAMGWQDMKSRTEANAKTIAEETSRAEARHQTLQNRVAAVEIGLARSDERYNHIIALLARIDARLERFEGASPR